MTDGWIKTHRKLLEWEWFTSGKHLVVWTTLLLRANYKKTKWRGVVINEGQLLTGLDQLCFWTKLSKQNVRTVLKDLISTGEITRKTTNKYSIITIVNWDQHQSDNTQDNIRVTSGQHTTNIQLTASKKEKKEKKEKNMSDFDLIYSDYPNKKGKQTGLKKYTQQIKTIDKSKRLHQAVKNYASYCKENNIEKKYIKHFSTFMNDWHDWIEYETPENELVKFLNQEKHQFKGDALI